MNVPTQHICDDKPKYNLKVQRLLIQICKNPTLKLRPFTTNYYNWVEKDYIEIMPL